MAVGNSVPEGLDFSACFTHAGKLCNCIEWRSLRRMVHYGHCNEVATADVWSGDCIIAISTLLEFFKESQHVAKASL